MARVQINSKSWEEKLLIKLGFIVISVAILVYFLPQESSSSLQFDLGKPWKYNSLIADFDFPILKNDQDIDREKDSLLRTFSPYYYVNDEIAQNQISHFLKNTQDSASSIDPAKVNEIVAQIEAIYSRGIVNSEEYNRLDTDTDSNIRIIENNQAKTVRLKDLYSIKSAYEALKKSNETENFDFSEYIVPNLILDSAKTEIGRKDLLSSLTLASGVVIGGQKIIDKGEIVDENKFDILLSYEKEITKRKYSSHQSYGILLGQILFITILLVCYTIYLSQYRKEYFENIRNLLMLYSLLVVFPIILYAMVQHQILSVYIIPFAVAPIFISVFLDSHTAFFTHLTIMLLCACSLRFPYEFIVVQTVAGFAAVASLKDLSSRSQLIKTAVIVTLSSALTFFAIELVQNGNLNHLDRRIYQYLFTNGLLLLFAYPFMWGIEKAFGFTSNVTLVELSNTNNSILRKLSEVAPGTFQHSIQVGNLAAEVANRIGANSQLVRTGALYHDIGKMNNPAFFIENQSGFNPHEKISPLESANIVISHVTDGDKIAEKHSVPQIIRDFIITHHGQGQCRYFYNEYQNLHPDENVDVLSFTYPGPNPFTLEQAILMMTDTVEAASRSLTDYSEKSITEMVNRLIDQQLNSGFFRDCPITFKDITIAKTILSEKLKTINHTRIKYPEIQSGSTS